MAKKCKSPILGFNGVARGRLDRFCAPSPILALLRKFERTLVAEMCKSPILGSDGGARGRLDRFWALSPILAILRMFGRPLVAKSANEDF